MPSFTHLTAALALTGAAVANPIEKRSAFSIEQVPRNTYMKIGPQQVVNTLRKFKKPVPQHLLDAVATYSVFADSAVGDNTGTVPAVPEQFDQSYLSPVTVGQQTLHLDFDTGSADLWVFSSLQAQSALAGHDYYKVDSTKEKSGYTWKISYGDGSGASGKVYADKVVVGGVTATSQAVEAATAVSAQFAQDVDNDGLLGLAMSSINTVKPQQQKTFFDTVRSQLAKPVFAIQLKYHAAGSYDFGFIDSSKYTGPITYINADASQGFWGFSGTGYSVGTGATTSASISGIVDSGTSLLYIDPAIVKAYYAKVTGSKNDSTQGGYTVPCKATLPDFSITIGGVKQTVPGKYINYAPINSAGTTCFGGIQDNTDIGITILGDVFIKSKYIIHEMGTTPRLGFAQQAGV